MTETVSTDAPGELEIVRRFVNTRELFFDGRPERDDLDSPRSLAAWLEAAGLPSGDAAPQALRRARDLREALRALLLANVGEPLDARAVSVCNEIAAAAPVRVIFAADGTAAVEPVARGVEAGLGALLAIVQRAQVAGTWERLKACRAHDCEWAYYDHSRNHSRAWCDMSVCGNRAKARAFRRRSAAS